LPSLAISVFVVSIVARFIRSEMLEVMGQDYITLAKAKGLSSLAVILRHVLRNAMIPLVTVLAPLAVYLITGTVVIEVIFAIPGIGWQFVNSVQVNDYSMILGTTIFFSVFFIMALLIQDILYGIIDPRIRVSGARE
jgi:oligopeptide transport system permease protein